MEPGHSRLLKFLLPNNKLNMSTQQVMRVEYVRSPSSVECSVPDQQPIRQPSDDVISSKNGGNQSDAADNGTFVPVYNMRVEEAAFTKGDQKLQKVTVTENISDNDIKIVNPMYSEIHNEVITQQHPLRIPKDDDRSDEDSELKRPKSRIPKLRQVAEKFKQDRREEREKNPSRQPRRSSIPTLKRAKIPSSTDRAHEPATVAENIKNQDKTSMKTLEVQQDTNNLPPEEEFEKMFDEIIQHNNEPAIDTIINLEDPEKLEHSFEEIIHDYEDDKIKPIDVDEIRRNLLAKRKSLPNQALPRKIERRSSLKNKEIDNIKSVAESEIKVSKLDEIKKRFETLNRKNNSIPKNVEAQNKAVTNKELRINKSETIKIDTNKTNNKKINMHKETQKKKFDNAEEIELVEIPKAKPKIESTKTKPQIRESVVDYKDDKLQGLKSQELKDILCKTEEPLFTQSSKTDFHKNVPKINTIIFDSKTNKGIEKVNTSTIPNINIVSESCTEDLLDSMDKKNHIQDSAKTREHIQEIPRIYLEKLNINEPTGLTLTKHITPPNTPQVHESEFYRDSAQLAGEPKILNIDSDDDYIDEDLSLIQSNVYKSQTPSVSTKSKHRPQRLQLSARDVYNQIDQVKTPCIDFESPNADEFYRAPLFEAYNKKIITETENKENGLPLQGKVSKILNRITSIEKSSENYAKTDTVPETPIRKSVSSRIAIFERQVSKSSELKPKIQQLNSKPKIIEQVLKAQLPRDTALDSESNSVTESDEIEIHKESDDNRKCTLFYENVEHTAQVVEVQDADVSNNQEDISVMNRESVAIQEHNNQESNIIPSILMSHSDKIKEKLERDALVKRVQERLNRVTSINEERNLKKRKSVVELDLGDKVKGKVNTMIVRMNSVEHLEPEKKNNINIRERPRKKSVSDKIALFEKMLSSVEMTGTATSNNGYENGATIATTPKPIIKNTSPRNYQNVFSSVSTEAICIDQSSTPKAPTVDDNVIISSTPETQKITASRNEKNVIKSVEANKITDHVESNTTPTPASATTPDSKKAEYYNRRIEDLKGAAKKYGRMNMTKLRLRNGQEMPVLVLGTALLDETLLPYVIRAAIDLGYRAIDTAFIYGNENAIGKAIQDKIDDGTVKREDLFIIGKLWSTFHRQDLVEQACKDSLNLLGIEYFDLYLVHNPMSFKEDNGPLPTIANVLQYSVEADYLDAWYGLEDLVNKGFAKSIGVSNFNSQQIDTVATKGRIKPAVNMVECHPYLNQQSLDQWCADRNVSLLCYGTLGSKGTPAEFKANQDSVIDDPLVRTMAAGLNVSPAQLLIRYQIESGHGVVTKCTSAAHLWDNLQALTFKLTSTEMDALNALSRGQRNFSFKGMGDTHRNYPFKIPF